MVGADANANNNRITNRQGSFIRAGWTDAWCVVVQVAVLLLGVWCFGAGCAIYRTVGEPTPPRGIDARNAREMALTGQSCDHA